MRFLLVNIFFFFALFYDAQTGVFVNGTAASLRVDSSAFLSIEGDFQNLDCDPVRQVRFNGPLFICGNFVNNDSIKFAPLSANSKKARLVIHTTPAYLSNSSIIRGSVTPVFWEVEINKIFSNVFLETNVISLDTVNLISGLVLMNGNKWTLKDPSGAPSVINHPWIKNERHGNEFTILSNSDSGMVIYKTIYSSSLNINPGNIGIEINGPVNVGSPLHIYRGHFRQVNAAKSSITKYFDIYSPGHSLASNSIKMKYTLNNLTFFGLANYDFPSLKLYASPLTDMNWSQLPGTIQNTLVGTYPAANGLMSVNLSDLTLPNINLNPSAFRITIADPNCPAPPVSALLLDTVYICSGQSMVLDAGNNTAIPNTSLQWQWNHTSTLYTRTISVSPTGAHQKISLLLKDVKGCLTKDSIVIAPRAPYPQITYLNHLNACLGDSVTIKDSVKITSGSFTNQWLYSNGSTGTNLNNLFWKKFGSAGTYSLQLITTSNRGCSVTATASNIIVYPLPTASFSHSLNCSNGTFNFSNTSVTNYSPHIIASSFWNLGLGPSNTSTIFSPSQVYAVSGTYTVKLVTSSSFGCKDSILAPLIVHPLNQAAFGKNNACFGDTVFLNNTTACNTGSCSYIWYNGDGTQSNSFSQKKLYANQGLYLVKLLVTNPLSCPDSITTAVFVNTKPSAQFTVVSYVCLNEYAYFNNTSSIGSGSITTWLWNYGNSISSTSVNGAQSYTQSGLYNVSLTATSDSGCVGTFTQPFDVKPKPTSQFSVSTVCLGATSKFTSTSSGNGLSYIWDFGNSVTSGTVSNAVFNYKYSAAGIYSTSLIVTNLFSCSDTAYVPALVLSKPQAGLGGNISTCGTSYILNAGNPGATFTWQPGSYNTPSYTVNSSGVYHVVITGTNGCVDTETVSVVLNALVIPNLGNDTTICGAFKLDAGYPGSVYLWNNSANSQTLLATLSGTYAVNVTDLNGCSGSDTIALIIKIPAELSLGNDMNICKQQKGIVLTPSTNAISYLWNTGSITPQIVVETAGTYWLEVVAANGCTARDTIQVSFKPTPSVDLGPDQSACGSVFLDAKNSGSDFLWSNGTSGQTFSAVKSGTYWVVVTNTLNQCQNSDSVKLIIHPAVLLNLGNDTSVCSNTNFFLDAKNPGSGYRWISGDTTATLAIKETGIYGLRVESPQGCFATDYIAIAVLKAPFLDLDAREKYLCGNKPLIVNLKNTGTINWGTGISTISSQSLFTINQPGLYWVRLTEGACTSADTFLVTRSNQTIQAQFLASTIDTVNKPVQFINLSKPIPDTQFWWFGDGTTSSELNPVHTYVVPTDFNVTLEVKNAYCTDRITKSLNVMFREMLGDTLKPANSLELETFALYPNPGRKFFTVKVVMNEAADLELKLLDIGGRLLADKNDIYAIEHSETIDTETLSNGMYYFMLRASNGKGAFLKTFKYIKTD